jgi:hypothetical protein
MMYFKFSIECTKLNSNCRTDYTTRRINTYLPFPFSPAVLRQCPPSSMVVPCPWWPVGWWLVSEAVMAMADGTDDGCLCGLCQCASNHAGKGTRAVPRWNCWLSKGLDCLTSTNLIQLGLLYCYKAQTWPKPKARNVSLAVIVYLRTSDLPVKQNRMQHRKRRRAESDAWGEGSLTGGEVWRPPGLAILADLLMFGEETPSNSLFNGISSKYRYFVFRISR